MTKLVNLKWFEVEALKDLVHGFSGSNTACLVDGHICNSYLKSPGKRENTLHMCIHVLVYVYNVC